ncbi:MAG: TrkA family potassium uptake protein [Bacteroidia bacterium]|nr:TrkA family potassium uptake protein [Bacteroidia bacterium]
MKFIIIGLGNFGSSLSAKLTALGHEVIGVDNNISRIEMVKDKITHVIQLDCTDIHAVKTLPLKDADIVVVAIGEDVGASIMTTALLKQLNVKKLISRAISPLHQTVLEAIGIHEIAHPEQDSADRMVKRLELRNIVDFLDISDEYIIIETVVNEIYVGKTIREADFRGRYNVNVLTIKRTKEEKNILGISHNKVIVLGVVSSEEIFHKGDILVIFGKITDVKKFLFPEE